MKSIDQIPAIIGLCISVVMVLGGLFLGYQMLPDFFGSTSANSIAVSASQSPPLGDVQELPMNIVFSQDDSEVQVADADAQSAQTDAAATDGDQQNDTSAEMAAQSSATADDAEETPSSAALGDSALSNSGDANSTDDVLSSQPIQVIYTTTPPPTLQEWISSQPYLTIVGEQNADASQPVIRIGVERQNSIPIFKRTFAAATRFNTLESDLTLTQIRAIWQNTVDSLAEDKQPAFTNIVVRQEDVPGLSGLLGAPSIKVEFATSFDRLKEAAKSNDPTLVLVPFEQLIPSWAVLAVNGENPVENANNFTDGAYPLKATFYLRWQNFTDTEQPILDALLRDLPQSNRDPMKLTVLAMTGVTAMVRGTAAQMDRFGSTWPAEIVGPELASADITHISNEVPFVEDCETEIESTTLIFCSKLSYMDTLQASGVDIIGLTGNHQNDYGREDALSSLEFYESHNLPVYGGGTNQSEANAPLYLTHNGNRLAFLGSNSYGPDFAWATEDRPGSARFDLNIMSATIRAVKEKNLADVVFAEVQYQETYDVTPLIDQRLDFNALLRAGADVVTGVQSHVPQAIEITDGKLVLFGLGNLYFDQMWSQPVREGLIVKHTIYDGRHISTQLLTTMLHDFGQPHWTTPQERELLLNRIFQASYWE